MYCLGSWWSELLHATKMSDGLLAHRILGARNTGYDQDWYLHVHEISIVLWLLNQKIKTTVWSLRQPHSLSVAFVDLLVFHYPFGSRILKAKVYSVAEE